MVRLQKFLAEAGVASRRASEKIIVDGRVTVNGVVMQQLGARVDPGHDEVALDGRPLGRKKKLYVALHKPRGYICTRGGVEIRDKIGDLLPREWSGLFSVGRLDRESEGLIFLTNDGDFSLKLTHPRYQIEKTYVAHVEGHVTTDLLRRFVSGIRHEGERLKVNRARILRPGQSTCIVELKLSEGKNHEVRRLFESQGMVVRRLQRVQIGPIKLGELPSGRWRALTLPEIKSLLSPL